ncbi:MAG: glycosyltransferase [Armatimonadota bacterium]|nr:glycosyltransferase [Armatimonadota bacterium]MDR7552926.1 glycosyltransferase [Armatimonadota bacterium]
MTRPLCIAMCSESYLPRTSGVVHSLAALSRALRDRGHRVVIAAPRYPGHTDEDPDVIRFPSLRPPHQPDFPLALPYAPTAWRRLDAVGPELVHTHGPFVMGAVALRLARRRRLPLVFTHHTLYDEYVHYAPLLSRRVSAPAVRRFVTAYANRCACVVAPTRAVAQRLREQGVRARIAVIPTGTIDLQIFAGLDRDGVRGAYGIPQDIPLVVTASRLGREKSVSLVLEAFARIAARRPGMLLVVGGGPEEKRLRAQAADLGLRERVVFAGALPHRRALAAIAAGDLFLYASQTETQGIVVVEAMAAGVPVVAVDAAGVSEAVADGQTGLLAPAEAEALAARALALLDDPARRRAMGAAAREAARAYALDAVTDRMEALYASLLERGA